MKAFILAAGLGTRLRPYTDHRPKALFTINQRPVLQTIIEKLQVAGFDGVWVNTHHHYDQIEAFVADTRFSIPVTTVREVDILGTGGAIRNVAGLWKEESLLIINADVVSDIDPAGTYAFHQAHGFPVTMVMHDRPEFNTVCVDDRNFVEGFDCRDRSKEGERVMAFTGIHVINRRVLDFLPSEGPAHIIDAYARMLASGERIRASVVTNHYWQDIGTPDRYRSAVYDQMAPLAFEAAFGRRPGTPITKYRLHGDGSDRQWYRLSAGDQTLILADHGIRTDRDQQEVDAYVSIGKHLHAGGITVPRIHLHDNCSGLVFVEDIGDEHLQTLGARSDDPQKQRLYRQVIDQWLSMAVEGRRNFDSRWTYQSARYDREVILEKECRYFMEAFVRDFLGLPWTYDEFQTEFESIAREIGRREITGFLHRDFQSRNIMVRNADIFFIDFQGGRIGPIQYDLASLLIDPYAALSTDTRDQLKTYAAARLEARYSLDAEKFLAGYDMCAISRNLQILGAFAFLSRKKGKTRFEKYIPCAVHSLIHNLSLAPIPLPNLTVAARKIAGHLAHMPCGVSD